MSHGKRDVTKEGQRWESLGDLEIKVLEEKHFWTVTRPRSGDWEEAQVRVSGGGVWGIEKRLSVRGLSRQGDALGCEEWGSPRLCENGSLSGGQ